MAGAQTTSIEPNLVSLVAELTRRGERITSYSSETFRPVIERAGAEFRSIDAFITERTVVDENLVRFASTLMQTTQSLLPALLAETSATHPDYVIYDSLCIWGRCVAESLRIPAVASISTLAQPHAPLQREVLAGALSILPRSISMLLAARRELQAFNATSNQLQQTYHCPRIGLADAYNNLAGLNIVYSIKEVQTWPHAFDERFRFVGPFLGGRGAAPAFPLEELGDQPVIYISLGTVFNAKTDFYRLCFDAFTSSAYRVVLATGDKTNRQLLGEFPTNFIVRSTVPQLEILRRAALFITHGGMNSVNEGLAFDVPLLLIPQGADQFLIAWRIQQVGAGVSLRNPSSGQLRDTAEKLLATPAYREQSVKLGAALRTAGGPSVAADAIEAYSRITP